MPSAAANLHILILSRGRHLYSTRRLVEAGARRGHQMRVADPMNLLLSISGRDLHVFENGELLNGCDVVVPRIGWTVADLGVAVVEHFERIGAIAINRAQAIARAGDKLRGAQWLSQHDIPVPRTILTRRPADVAWAIEQVGGPPVVLKFLQGAQGVGVMLADSRRAAESILDALWGLNRNVLIQEYVEESSGSDVRVFVIGGRAVAAMRRRARGSEFRSNLHRGGWGEPVPADSAFGELAQIAARTLDLDVAGVDLLEAKTGPLVVEVNASPGLEGIEEVTRVDVADAFIAHIEERARRGQPPADVRGADRPFFAQP
jgi:ribosomal protein S6--L-glutamate ligase